MISYPKNSQGGLKSELIKLDAPRNFVIRSLRQGDLTGEDVQPDLVVWKCVLCDLQVIMLRPKLSSHGMGLIQDGTNNNCHLLVWFPLYFHYLHELIEYFNMLSVEFPAATWFQVKRQSLNHLISWFLVVPSFEGKEFKDIDAYWLGLMWCNLLVTIFITIFCWIEGMFVPFIVEF